MRGKASIPLDLYLQALKTVLYVASQLKKNKCFEKATSSFTIISSVNTEETPVDETLNCGTGLYIQDGPFADSDLCSEDNGYILISICNDYSGGLTFYYNGILIPDADVIQRDDKDWSVRIVNLLESAELRIVNENRDFYTDDIEKSDLCGD